MPNEIKRLDAKERIRKFAEQRTEKFNSEHKLQSFRVGELILLKASNVSSSIDNTTAKFHRLYNGPFMLSELVGKHTYIVTNPNTNKTIGKFHASSLRKYYIKN